MNRKIPSFIVLIDLLFMLVFVLMLKQEKSEYEFYLSAISDNNQDIYIEYYIENKKIFKGNKEIVENYEEFHIYANCPTNFYFESTPSKCKVYYAGSLADQITRLILLGCEINNCKKINIPITNQGMIDKEKFRQMNEKLLEKNYIQQWIKT